MFLNLKKTVLPVLVAVAVMFVMCEAAFAAADTIGTINSQEIISKHPKFKAAADQLQQIGRQKESEAKAAADKETDPSKKAQAVQAKRMELAQEEERLMGPIFKDCETAVRTVAKAKKITVVLEKASVYFGGMDITADVIQHMQLGK